MNPPLNLPAFLSALAVTAILVRGIKESANFNFVIVILKVATVLIFCGTAAQYLLGHPEIALANWTPLVPPNTGEFGHFGWSGVARGAAVIFFAYIGFDSVSTAAQEAKNPKRDMPIGLLASLAICTFLYMLTALMLTGVAPYQELNVAAPVAAGMDRTGVRWGGTLVRLGTMFGLTTTMLVTLLGQSRVFFAMSRDGLLPPFVGVIHPRYQTPHRSLWTVGLGVAIIAALFPIGELGQLVSIGTLLAFAIVCGAVMLLRYRHPELERPFRTPLFPYVPIGGILISLGLMASLPAVTWWRLIAWLVLGFAIYGFYGRKRSRVRAAFPSPVPVADVASG